MSNTKNQYTSNWDPNSIPEFPPVPPSLNPVSVTESLRKDYPEAFDYLYTNGSKKKKKKKKPNATVEEKQPPETPAVIQSTNNKHVDAATQTEATSAIPPVTPNLVNKASMASNTQTIPVPPQIPQNLDPKLPNETKKIATPSAPRPAPETPKTAPVKSPMSAKIRELSRGAYPIIPLTPTYSYGNPKESNRRASSESSTLITESLDKTRKIQPPRIAPADATNPAEKTIQTPGVPPPIIPNTTKQLPHAHPFNHNQDDLGKEPQAALPHSVKKQSILPRVCLPTTPVKTEARYASYSAAAKGEKMIDRTTPPRVVESQTAADQIDTFEKTAPLVRLPSNSIDPQTLCEPPPVTSESEESETPLVAFSGSSGLRIDDTNATSEENLLANPPPSIPTLIVYQKDPDQEESASYGYLKYHRSPFSDELLDPKEIINDGQQRKLDDKDPRAFGKFVTWLVERNIIDARKGKTWLMIAGEAGGIMAQMVDLDDKRYRIYVVTRSKSSLHNNARWHMTMLTTSNQS